MAASPEGGQELTERERQLLEETETRSYSRSEVPERVWRIFEDVLFKRVKIPKQSSVDDLEEES